MKIVELTSQDTAAYKAFFLQGLQDHPDCFRISPDDELHESFPTRNREDSFTLAIIDDSERMQGVVSFLRDGSTRERLKHKGLLFRMYVHKENHGKGYGKILISELIERVKKHTDIEQINLTVISTNTGAKKLYERFGFKTFSVEYRAIKDANVYRTEEQMVLFIK